MIQRFWTKFGPAEVPAVAERVAFCITELDPGGAERALFEIVTRLDPQLWTAKVFCLGPETELAQLLREQGIETVCFGARHVYQFGVVWYLARQLKAFRPAVLQTFLFHANIMGRLAGWWAGVPVILSGLRVAERAKRWHLWCDRWTSRMVQYHVCVSEGVRTFAIEQGRLRPETLRVIPNGVDAERFANATPMELSQFGIPANTWTLVTVGRLTPQKGHEDLIRAVVPLLKEERRMHLLIVGEGPERNSLEGLADSCGVREQIHFPGFQANIPGILRSCQAFVLASRWEGMPNALLEAQAAGLPCIATDVEGVREVLEDESGKLVTPGDQIALREAVQEARHQMLGPASPETQSAVLKRHTWNNVAEKYSDLFTECLPTGAELQS